MNRLIPLFAAICLIAACDNNNEPAEAGPQQSAAAAPTGVAEEQSPQELFMARLAEHCGRAYEGRIVANEPAMDDDPFEGQRLVMHVRECGENEIKIPFHVGDDHSRTWVITHVAAGVEGMDGLRLKHDHRHEDGTPDEVTMYGGDTAGSGTPRRQEFPVDQESREMFEAGDMHVSMSNTWAMEIEADKRFMYELSRPEGRLFQVEFDLTNPVELPPDPWGHELVKVPSPD
ncbi:MAG: hypothetical protein WD081_03985 [Gammaproteobacteria bacterium]